MQLTDALKNVVKKLVIARDPSSLTSAVGAWALQNRRLARSPLWFYRHGFGRLLGSRILMLEHTGRRSGLTRQVCLEVVERPGPDTVVIVSGFGTRAQWYRNLEANPRCHVTIGGEGRRPALARLMAEGESTAVLSRYQAAHPAAWRRLRGVIEHATGRPADLLPMVELTLS